MDIWQPRGRRRTVQRHGRDPDRRRFRYGLTALWGGAVANLAWAATGVLPRKFFGYLKPGSGTPTYTFLLIGGLAFVGAVLLYHIGNAYEPPASFSTSARFWRLWA